VLVLSQSFHCPTRSFHSPCTVLSRSLNFPLMVISQSFHGLFTVFNVEPKSWSSSYAPLKQNLYLGDPPCPEVGPGASMPFIYIHIHSGLLAQGLSISSPLPFIQCLHIVLCSSLSKCMITSHSVQCC
jgi:hypothetical protein